MRKNRKRTGKKGKQREVGEREEIEETRSIGYRGEMKEKSMQCHYSFRHPCYGLLFIGYCLLYPNGILGVIGSIAIIYFITIPPLLNNPYPQGLET